VIARTRVSRMLGEFRDKPAVDMAALENVLLRVSELVCELPHVTELDINPLIVDEHGALAVDARMLVDYPPAGARRYDHMAIHPYPSHLLHHEQLPDGTNITIRPIRPEDARIEADFVRQLSPESKYFRFMRALHELTPEMLVRFTQIDYDLEMALIVTVEQMDEEIEVAVARYATNPDGESCEFAIVVSDQWHHRGLGMRLMQRLMAIARDDGLKTMEGEVMASNHQMLALCTALGFSIQRDPEDPHLRRVTKPL
jgi:acetyltransferase